MNRTATTVVAAPQAPDIITAAVALALCALETIARAAVAAYVLGRSIRRAIASHSAPALAPASRPAPPYVHPLWEALAPLSCAQLRRLTGARRHEPHARLAALAVA